MPSRRDATVTVDKHRVDPEVKRKDAGTGDSAAPAAAAAPPSNLLPLPAPPSQSRVAIILGPSDPKHLIYAGSKSKPIKAAPAASGKNRRPPVSPTAPTANCGFARSPFG
ncbi:hypothetical protein PAHAL_4G126100 [Panicum hallii]|uniref:Uncharacterized protein n=1 Tax=Panicum hallii TaxID=206008 RepID=A0A2T8JCR2_9POAL|nr:hypothetical protein PAHAL_4G126100 [Panicum hallii]